MHHSDASWGLSYWGDGDRQRGPPASEGHWHALPSEKPFSHFFLLLFADLPPLFFCLSAPPPTLWPNLATRTDRPSASPPRRRSCSRRRRPPTCSAGRPSPRPSGGPRRQRPPRRATRRTTISTRASERSRPACPWDPRARYRGPACCSTAALRWHCLRDPPSPAARDAAPPVLASSGFLGPPFACCPGLIVGKLEARWVRPIMRV